MDGMEIMEWMEWMEWMGWMDGWMDECIGGQTDMTRRDATRCNMTHFENCMTTAGLQGNVRLGVEHQDQVLVDLLRHFLPSLDRHMQCWQKPTSCSGGHAQLSELNSLNSNKSE